MRNVHSTFVLIVILLPTTFISLAVNGVVANSSGEKWALIICGSVWDSFHRNTAYMYHILSEHYCFDGIIYLSTYASDPGVTGLATLDNVRFAINTTLAGWSDENDIVFIYFSSHGGGYNARHNQNEGGRLDVDGDEGDEVMESTLGIDVNEDGDMNDWVGIDESMQVMIPRYWDDELESDLNAVTYSKLVFVRQGCVEGNQTCFGGGLIDDLSAANRIIMCATNETWYSYGDRDAPGEPGYGYSEWSEAFMDALHGERTFYNDTTAEIVHGDGEWIVDADSDDDGYVSLWEAWEYAWNHDDACLEGDETPWFDDDGDGLPTFINGADHLDTDGQGDLAEQTYLAHKPPHGFRLSISASPGGTTDPHPGIYYKDAGEVVTVYADADSGYVFSHWVIDGSPQQGYSASVLMDQDHFIEAHFDEAPNGGGGGGGGMPGCPFVYTWNGTGYAIDNNLLGDSEASGGADVEDYYRLEQPLVRREGKYSLLISEFEQEHSYIDQVKLMAVDHESDVHVAVTHGGEILTYKEPSAPVSVVDNDGESWLDVLKAADGCYYKGFPGDHLLIDFGDLDVSQGAKLVFRDDFKFKDAIFCLHVQIFDADDGWKDIATFRTRAYWATDIVDLADHLPDANGELKVRLYFTGIHKIDYVGLDTTKQDDSDLHHANLVSATHSEEGDVKTELLESDSLYAELIPDQQIELAFTLPENSKDTRTYIVYAKGRYYTIS